MSDPFDPTLLDTMVTRALTGDQEAFTSLMVACQQELRAFLSAHCTSLDMIDEVTQSTFVTAYRRLGTYRVQGSFLPWLKGISRNLLREELRRRSRQVQVEGDVLESLLVNRREQQLDHGRPEPASIDQLRRCLESLPPTSLKLVESRYIEGLSVVEIARHIQHSANWVAVNLCRIRVVLRTCVERHGAKEIG